MYGRHQAKEFDAILVYCEFVSLSDILYCKVFITTCKPGSNNVITSFKTVPKTTTGSHCILK